jgi:hypothetical protein
MNRHQKIGTPFDIKNGKIVSCSTTNNVRGKLNGSLPHNTPGNWLINLKSKF